MGKTKGIAHFLSSASPPRVWNKAKNRKTDGFIHLQFLTDFVTVIPHLIKTKLTPTKLNSVSLSDKPASQQTSWSSVKGRFYFLSFWLTIIKTLKLYLTYLSTLNASCTYLPTHPNTSFTFFFFLEFHTHLFLDFNLCSYNPNWEKHLIGCWGYCHSFPSHYVQPFSNSHSFTQTNPHGQINLSRMLLLISSQ